jgi:cytosine/adenosine deaminase-related metal-dependent hydrolase
MLLKNLLTPGMENEISSIGIRGDRITKSYDDNIILDFSEAIAFPGLINSHDHLEFNLFPKLGNRIYKDYVEWGSDIHIKNREIIEIVKKVPYELRFRWGLYKNLLCGVTSVAHHGNRQNYNITDMPDLITNYNYLHSIQLEKNWKFKLNLMPNRKPFVVHIGEGTNKNSSDEINRLLKWNITGRKLIGVHAISLDNKNSNMFEAIVWCPQSNLFLYNKTADITNLKKETTVLFGTDSSLSSDWNIWNHLRSARSLGCLSDIELFDSITGKAAVLWGINSTGALTENSKANIVVSKRSSCNVWEDFYNNNSEDILLIVKNGRIVFLDKEYEDKNHVINKTGFDLIEMNYIKKYVIRGLKELVTGICKYIPDYEFPFKIL